MFYHFFVVRIGPFGANSFFWVGETKVIEDLIVIET